MPTGYTADIAKGISFEQFALRCARAFGATIPIRDESIDAEIPEFKPSTYYAEQATKYREQLAEITIATDADLIQRQRNAFTESLLYHQKREAERVSLLRKYRQMLEKVDAWAPPTPDHTEMKAFMKQQIEQSIDFDCSSAYPMPTPPSLSAATYKAREVSRLVEEIQRYDEEQRKENERTTSRNKWVADLRASLGLVASH